MEITILEMTFVFGNFWAAAQTIAAFLSFGVSALGLGVLIRYARDTKTMAQASLRQIEDATIPNLTVKMLTVEYHIAPAHRETYLAIVNQGRGPAINVRLEGKKGTNNSIGPVLPSEWVDVDENIGDLAIGDNKRAPDWLDVCIQADHVVTMTYQSLYGTKYRSVVESQMKVTFHLLGKA